MIDDFFAHPWHALAERGPAAIVGWRIGDLQTSSVAASTVLRCVRADAFLLRVTAWRALAQRTTGNDIALFHDDSIEFAAALLGAWQCGKTVWLSADRCEASCSALAQSGCVFWGQFPARWQPLLPSESADPAVNADAQHLSEPTLLQPSRLQPDFIAVVVHTSGSTGAAQAIPKRLSQLVCELVTLERLFGPRVNGADVIATVSHQHIYGLLFKVLWPLATGRAIHGHSLDFPEQLAQQLGCAPCVLVTSPAHLKRLPDHLDWSAAAAQLRAVFSSGGALAPGVALASARLLGQAAIEVYGSSETGGIGWRQRSVVAENNDIGSSGNAAGDTADDDVWQALPGVAWRIAHGSDALEVRSPHLNGDAWLTLADRARAGAGGDAGGGFLLLGRSDSIVKIEEKRISLDAIEAALCASNLVREVRVIALPLAAAAASAAAAAAGRRQRLGALVVLSGIGNTVLAGDGKLALNRCLRAALIGVIDPVALPRRWRYVDSMPLNAQGKTSHASLLALFDQPQPSQQRQSAPRLPSVVVLERAPDRVLLELTIPVTLFYFDGHFPQAPVLPGVVQVDWAIRYARQHFELAPHFCAIHALKFSNLIRGARQVYLELRHDALKNHLNFRYFSDAGQHASGRILFGV